MLHESKELQNFFDLMHRFFVTQHSYPCVFGKACLAGNSRSIAKKPNAVHGRRKPDNSPTIIAFS